MTQSIKYRLKINTNYIKVMENLTYQKLLEIRKKTDLKFNKNKYLKESTNLRYYQIIGLVHLYMLKRMVLGDPTGVGKCCTYNTKLITNKGILSYPQLLNITSKESFNKLTPDTFYNISEKNINVAQKNNPQATKVYFGGKKPVISFKTDLGLSAECTENHAWKVMSDSGQITWRYTKDLKVGDYIAVGRGQNLWGDKSINPDLAWFLGNYIGCNQTNSHIRYTTHYSICIFNNDKNIIDKSYSTAKNFFPNLRTLLNRGHINHSTKYSFYAINKEHKHYFLKKNQIHFNKENFVNKIPGILKDTSKESNINFLKGLYSSCGYFYFREQLKNIGHRLVFRLVFRLASKNLAKEIQLLLLNLGIISKLVKTQITPKYRLIITNISSLEIFKKEIGLTKCSESENLDKVLQYILINNQCNSNREYIPNQKQNIEDLVKLHARGLDIGNSPKIGYSELYNLFSLIKNDSNLFEKQSFKNIVEILTENYYFAKIINIKPNGLKPVMDIEVPEGNAYLANGMVSHNTIQAIGAYTSILDKNENYKLMIVCPSSALYQWANEFKKFCNNIKIQVIESTETKTVDSSGKKITLTSFASRSHQFEQFEKSNADVVIFNYNTLTSDYLSVLEKLLQKYKFMVVFDEATAFKNVKSQTHEYCRLVSNQADRCYALSATIIKNNLSEAYAIFRVVLPGLLGPKELFEKNYFIKEKKQLWKGKGQRGKIVNIIKGYKNLDYFRKTIDPFFLGRKKEEIASELPEIITQEIYLNMNKEQKDLYDDVTCGFLDFTKFRNTLNTHLLDNEKLEQQLDSEENYDIKLIDKLAALIYFQQICNSPKTLGYDLVSIKETELLNILETELADEKVVIYSRFKKMINVLEQSITKKLKKNVLKITGDISSSKREEYKILFNGSTDHNIMLINSAAKEAVNLQSSGYLILYDLPYSYGDLLQIIGRIHRIGSPHEKITLIYLLCKNTIDEKVYKILQDKKTLFDQILGDAAIGAIKLNRSMNKTIDDIFNSIVNKKD